MPTIPVVLSMTALTVSLVSLALSYRAFKDQHRRRRLEYTLDMIKEWDKSTLNSRAAILAFHDHYDKSVPAAIPLEKIKEKRQQELDAMKRGDLASGTPLITDHIAVILNYMELFAIARQMKIVDEKYFEASGKVTFMRWHAAFKEYLDPYRNSEMRQSNPWQMVDELMDQWKAPLKSPVEPRSPG